MSLSLLVYFFEPMEWRGMQMPNKIQYGRGYFVDGCLDENVFNYCLSFIIINKMGSCK